MRHQRDHVAGVGRDQGECGHGAAAAREHLDRTGAEGLDERVQVGRLDLGTVVDPAVLAGAAAQAARVVGDHRAVGKCAVSAAKPLASIGWAIMTSGGRPSAVGSGPWTS